MQPNIIIIIVTFQAELYIKACINSLFQQTNKSFNIVIVDNNSSDNTKNLIRNIKKKHGNITLIENEKNYGFSKANNIGIKHALRNLSCDYFFLLNQDTVVRKDTLDKLLYWSNRNKSAVFGPKILIKKNHRIWWIGTRIFKLKDLFMNFKLAIGYQIDKEQEDYFFRDKPAEVEAIVGCALLFPKKIIDDVGYLDENFLMYGEDLDFSLRLAKKGYKLFVVPEAVVYHDVHLEKEAFGFEMPYKTLKRYYRYFLGSLRVLKKHFPSYYILIWLARVPFAILYEISKRVIKI